MAAPAVVRSSGPPLCPSFAEVCSFLERYGPALDLPEMTFPQMERYLRDTAAVPKPLVDLHVKLLRKLGKSVTTDRWEKYLAKVCQELNSTWAWELEQKGYQEMSMECKSSILKYLCECQFDDNLKFKTVVNEEDPEKMRLQPVGRDQLGLMYWLQLDQEQNIRLYTEEQDDLDGSTWKCIVRTRNDLAEALELLKAQIEPNQSQDQNQAGGGSPAEKQTGENEFGTSDAKLLTATEEEADNKLNLVKDEKPLKQGATQEEVPPVKQENPESVVMDKKPSAFDNRVSTITAVKSEPGDANTPKDAVPIVMATTVSLTKLSKDEEAKLAVVRSNQQAKIPLKKRDLKLADSFHSNHLNNSSSSSIIVCNPAAISSKDGKLLNSLGPQGGPASSQQQVVMAPRQELTNGRASHLPHKEGQNGVLGVTGQVVGHVGVIRSPSEYHRAPSAGQQEQNGPRSEPCGPRAVEEDKEVGRKSVLVRKGLTEPAATPAATFLPPDPATEDQKRGKLQSSSQKPDGPPEAAERKVGSVGAPSVSSVTVGKTDKDQDKNTKESGESRRQKDEDPEELGKEAPERRVSAGVKGDPGNTSARGDSKLSCTVLSLKIKKWDKTDQLGLNGGLASRVRLKSSGAGSEQKQGPLEEASSELQKEGIRLKIKIPPHRRNKLKKKGGKEEEEKEREVHEEGRSLRRSARICRSSALPNCRPSSKAAESQRKKPQKKQVAPARARGEEEAAEEEGDDKEHGSPAAKDRKAGPAGKLIKRRGKRRHGRPRWTNIRPKRRRPNEEEEVEDRGRKRGADEDEDEEEGVSHSEEESCKSEHVPSEDACTHCGLPNHPELILLCDSCDRGYHTACLRPPLMLIPDGEWFCPPCQHKMLCENLEEQLQNLDSALKKRERAERRRERLVYVGISVENIIPEGEEDEEEEKTVKPKDPKKSKNLGRRSTRTRKHISYRFDDFDDAIDEAIEEDVGDLCGGGAGRGKDIASVLSEDGKDSQRPIRSQTRSARNRKRRRLNDLESDSTAVESEDEFMLSNSSEDEEFGASGADDDGEEDDEDAGSDVGSWDKGTRPRRGLKGAPKYKPKRTQRRSRRRRRRRSTEEEEDTDIDMDSDQFSDMTDSDAEKKRRGLRRGQHQQVNYRETSESSDNSRPSTERVKVKRRGRPRKERLSSDFSDVSHSSKDSEEEDEEEDDQRRGKKRRREEREDLRGRRRREKQRGYEEEKDAGEGGRVKKRQLEKNDKRRLSRTEREEEDLEKMGRGKRREILSQQRRRRLAQMLKKRRPSTDEEEESEDSESSSEEDRPIRKRLNRIDSDDEEDEGQKAVSKRSSAAERRAGRRNERDAQEKGRGRSPSSSNRHQASRGPEKPGTGSATVPRDSATSGGQKRHNGPLHEDEEYEEEEEGQSSSVNSVQNSPRS